jgi:hypothetical protein
VAPFGYWGRRRIIIRGIVMIVGFCQDYGFFELFFRLFSYVFTRLTQFFPNDFTLYDTNEFLCSPSFLSFLMFPSSFRHLKDQGGQDNDQIRELLVQMVKIFGSGRC